MRRRWLLGVGWLLAMSSAVADDTPKAAFAYSDAAVNSFAFSVSRIYAGGLFDQFTTGTAIDLRHRLAGLDPSSGGVLPTWNQTQVADAIVSINSLVLSKDGRTLFVGGEFSRFGGVVRSNIAAVDAASGALLAWTPTVDGAVRTMALSSDGTTLYIGGDFLNVGGQARAHLAALTTALGQLTPLTVDTDATVRSVAVTSDGGTLFVAGDFTRVAGQSRGRLAAINISNGQATSWRADADAGVHRIAMSPDGADLYVGGDFTTITADAGIQTRSHLARLSTASPAILSSWAPTIDAAVNTLAVSRDGEVVFIGGAFSNVDTTARARIAVIDTAAGAVLAWNPGGTSAITQIGALEVSSDDASLFVGGDFSMIGGSTRSGMAVFAVAPPVTTLSPAAGGYASARDLTMSCVDNKGLACTSIRYTLDGSDPRTSATAVNYSGVIPITAASTTIRYSGIDGDGREEVSATAHFYVDGQAPTTTTSLNPGPYGKAEITALTLTCQDALDGSGCATTYFSGDGSEPVADLAHRYFKAIDLTGYLSDSAGDGAVTLKYFSVDNAGNQETTHTDVYTLDQNPPIVIADPLGATYSGPIDVTLTCDDQGGSGCYKMFYTLDGTKPSDGTVPASDGVSLVPATTEYTGPIHLSSGAPVSVYVIDNAGNSTSALIAIYSFNANRDDSRHGLAALDYPVLMILAVLFAVRRCCRLMG